MLGPRGAGWPHDKWLTVVPSGERYRDLYTLRRQRDLDADTDKWHKNTVNTDKWHKNTVDTDIHMAQNTVDTDKWHKNTVDTDIRHKNTVGTDNQTYAQKFSGHRQMNKNTVDTDI